MKYLFLLISCVFLFSSCSSDDGIISTNSVENESTDVNRLIKTIEFSYKGKIYSSEYYEEGDSVFILDYETQKVYNKLGQNENKFILVDEDNKVTYFDNESEYLEIEKSKPQLRSTDTTPYLRATVRLYQNFSPFDTMFHPTTTMLIESTHTRLSARLTTGEINLVSLPDLRVYNHNDNISLANVALSIGNMTPEFNFRGQASLFMYEHSNYGGESCGGHAAASWNDWQNGPMKPGQEVSQSTQVTVQAIKKWNGDSFNDIISSLKIVLSFTNNNWDGTVSYGRN